MPNWTKRSSSSISISNPSWFAINLARLASSVGFRTLAGSLPKSRAKFCDSPSITPRETAASAEDPDPGTTMERELRRLSRELSPVFKKSGS